MKLQRMFKIIDCGNQRDHEHFYDHHDHHMRHPLLFADKAVFHWKLATYVISNIHTEIAF